METTFLIPLTDEQIDRADIFFYHPITGMAIRSLDYDEAEKCFFYIIPGVRESIQKILLPRISNGKSYKEDEPYPEHWIYDPVTGEELRR